MNFLNTKLILISAIIISTFSAYSKSPGQLEKIGTSCVLGFNKQLTDVKDGRIIGTHEQTYDAISFTVSGWAPRNSRKLTQPETTFFNSDENIKALQQQLTPAIFFEKNLRMISDAGLALDPHLKIKVALKKDKVKKLMQTLGPDDEDIKLFPGKGISLTAYTLQGVGWIRDEYAKDEKTLVTSKDATAPRFNFYLSCNYTY
jgi:hypothetical protein